jgi:S-DNA-T family DNA segregation ATPase FtsK/SpoIIIE
MQNRGYKDVWEMKKAERIASIVVGFVLFTIAAVFSVSLMMQLLGSGADGLEQGGLVQFGRMLVSVYGFCSILIPVFLLVAGVSCFTEKWTAQKAACLMISFVPFFTAAAAERLCRNIATNDAGPLAAIKIISLLVISLLIIVAEYLITLVIVGKVGKNTPTQKKDDEDFIMEDDTDDEEESVSRATKPQPEKPDEITSVKPKWSFKSMFISGKQEDDADDEIDAAVDKSIVEATKSDSWTLEDLLKNHKHEQPKESKEEENQPEVQKNKYGKFDSGNSLKEASFVDDESHDESRDDVATLEPSVETLDAVPVMDASVTDASNAPSPAEEVTSDEGMEDLEQLVAKVGAGMTRKHESDQDDSSSDALPSVDEINNLDATPVDEEPVDEPVDEIVEDSVTESVDEPANDANASSATDEIDMNADPWNVTDTNTPEVIEEDPAGLVEPSDASDPTIADPDRTIISQDKTVNPTPPNFGKGSGIEEEPKNPKGTSTGHAMLSVLDGVFAKMDMDAKADVDSEEAVDDKEVDDENEDNLESKQIDDSLVDGGNEIDVPVCEEKETKKEKPVVPRAVPKRQKGPYKIPTSLLTEYADNPYWVIDEETKQASANLKDTLNEFRIEADVTGIRKGPVVTMFEILPAPGVKLSKIVALQDNIALRLAASSVRIVAPIPGKRAVGIEVPNKDRAIVSFRECIEQDLPAWKKMEVPVVLGKDIQGDTQIIDLVKTPHLLIAGSTGSGKSVCVNSMILSILYKRSPNDVKMILIDPKIVELKLYNDIPHLLTPVITEPKRAMQSLQYCLCEMERRYALLDGIGVRDIASYNKRIVERKICTEKLPYIVVIIDEFADLMATTGKELEGVVARLAAMSRAVGIHLVLATQRPSIDVITGLIKANIPSRVAFMVASKTDSRIIIDQVGAEKLLGKGDMLYASATDPFPVRIQGTFVSDVEVEDVVDAVKQWGEPEYIDDEIFVDDDEEGEGSDQMSLFSDGEDPLYEKALDIVVQAGKASASYIQRRLKVGYNRAARLVEEMEERGIVGPANGSKPREIIHMP